MVELENFEDLYTEIKNNVDSSDKNVSTIYAFNGTGKTRLSKKFNSLNNGETDEIKVLCYNAFLEDLFSWDNENFILTLNASWELKLIRDEGLGDEISKTFQRILNSKIEPEIELETGKIHFQIPTDGTGENIKISKGEESMFIWSVFHTILERIILILKDKKEDRSINIFDNLEYILIDDPVSSFDDNKIINLAMELIKVIKSDKEKNIDFLITTHHALFFNIFFNKFKTKNKFKHYILSKNKTKFNLTVQGNDTPFNYHLLVKNEIQNAVDNETKLNKYHFNLFRGLMEKTSNFLGIGYWGDCINKKNPDRDILIKTIDSYSHCKFSDLEYENLTEDEKNMFKESFESFIKEYKFN